MTPSPSDTVRIDKVVFREYDVRGTVDVDLSEGFAYVLGRAYGETVRPSAEGRPVAVGRDCRLTSEAYAAAFSRGVADEGVDVVLTGMGPTPQLYYAIYARGLAGGVQVTGSHNPSDMNGFKLCVGTHTLAGDEIQALYHKAVAAGGRAPGASKGVVKEAPIRDEYVAMLIENSKPHVGPRKPKVVVDAGNGVGGLVGPEVLRALGCEVIELFCDPDGRFPNHHPDPTVPAYLTSLIETVRGSGADFGIGWDGDADRIGVVDERGEIVFGDMLVLLYARTILKGKPGATVIGDVKCSSLLFDDVTARGGQAVMWKTGHSLIKGKLRELNADLAGEMSGHIFFAHRYFGFDDALYASCRLVEIVSSADGSFSSLLADLPKRVSTPELRVDCPEDVKFRVAEAARTVFPDYEVDTTDGVRVRFEKGWGLVRASNTQPVLVMRFEAETPELLERYREIVSSRIDAIKADLTDG